VTFLTPMKCAKVDVVPEGENLVLERKQDGWRCVAGVSEQGVWAETNTGTRITQVPYINEALAAFVPPHTVLDGELVDHANGEKQWNRTAKILQTTRGGYVHVPTEDDPPLTYVVFDIVVAAGHELYDEPLSVRRQALELIMAKAEAPIVLSAQLPATAEGLEQALREGYEGVVVKRLDSVYVQGAKNRGWYKCKPFSEVDALCTGTYPPTAGSKYEGRAVGGITFRVEHDDGRVYEGRSAGMDDDLREALYQDPTPYIGLMVELGHLGIGDEGALRSPEFRRFRDPADKAAPTPRPKGRTKVASANVKVSGGPSGRIRNYSAMKDKLASVVSELERGVEDGEENEAMEKARAGSGDPAGDLAYARQLLAERGVAV